MSESYSERRLAENEVMFRQMNAQVQNAYDETKRVASEEGQEFLIKPYVESIHFYCECADENCRQRIIMTLDTYNEIHKNKRRFVIKKGHDVKNIEKIVSSTAKYAVVEKYDQPPESAEKFNSSNVDNI